MGPTPSARPLSGARSDRKAIPGASFKGWGRQKSPGPIARSNAPTFPVYLLSHTQYILKMYAMPRANIGSKSVSAKMIMKPATEAPTFRAT